MTTTRAIKQIIKGIKASDGDGVQLTRLIGSPDLDMLDPFLLFDAFGSTKPQDYIGGFPSHPHRGFETVTYMLEGKMRHQDSEGNNGVISSGDVQWMTAGKGIIHSEMPEQEKGTLAGFQLWINLPAKNKMIAPRYQEITAKQIPVEHQTEHCKVKVIAGVTKNGTKARITNEHIEAIYWHISLTKNTVFTEQVPSHHNAFIYLLSGSLMIGDNKLLLKAGELAVLTQGEKITLASKSSPASFLFIAGKPLNETVVRAGPFVMNSHQQIQQAISDYQNGKLL